MSLLGPKTFWLLATNLLLGAAVLLCFAMIAWSVVRDIQRQRKRKKDESVVPRDYLDSLQDLGIAFPDGPDGPNWNERIDETVA